MRRILKHTWHATVAAIASAPAHAQMYPGYGHDSWGWGWGHAIFGSLMMIVFWGGIILIVVLAIRWLGGGSQQRNTGASDRNKALEILKERFARGEIEKEEFEERRRLLSD